MAPDAAGRLKRLNPQARAELYRLLSEPSAIRAGAISQLHSRPETQDLAEVLIDLETDKVLRLQVLRVLRDALG
jgi:hypothetical protein